MPFCTQCGAENPETARFCDQCGAEMVALPASSSTPPDAAAAGPVVSAGPQSCPQCGMAVIPGEAFCDSCGAPLLSVGQPAAVGATIANVPTPSSGHVSHQPTYPPPQPVSAVSSTPPVQPPASPTPVVPPAPVHATRVSLSSISLVVADTGDILSLPETSQAIVGRSDPVSKFFPDVDLASYGALQKGVGRRHMRLVVQNSQVCIEDLNSTNGTFLNSLRLVARMPQPVQDGDEVRLGNLVLRVQR